MQSCHHKQPPGQILPLMPKSTGIKDLLQWRPERLPKDNSVLTASKCFAVAAQVMQGVLCLPNWAKSFRKTLSCGIWLVKMTSSSWKKQRERFLQDVCVYIKLLQNKTSLGKTATCTWLWRAAWGRDSWGWCRSGVSCMGNVLILAHLLTLPALFCLCSYLAQIKY